MASMIHQDSLQNYGTKAPVPMENSSAYLQHLASMVKLRTDLPAMTAVKHEEEDSDDEHLVIDSTEQGDEEEKHRALVEQSMEKMENFHNSAHNSAHTSPERITPSPNTPGSFRPSPAPSMDSHSSDIQENRNSHIKAPLAKRPRLEKELLASTMYGGHQMAMPGMYSPWYNQALPMMSPMMVHSNLLMQMGSQLPPLPFPSAQLSSNLSSSPMSKTPQVGVDVLDLRSSTPVSSSIKPASCITPRTSINIHLLWKKFNQDSSAHADRHRYAQMREVLCYDHSLFFGELVLQANIQGPASSFSRLHQLYTGDLEKLENDRLASLMNNNNNPEEIMKINIKFDSEWATLLQQNKQEFSMLTGAQCAKPPVPSNLSLSIAPSRSYSPSFASPDSAFKTFDSVQSPQLSSPLPPKQELETSPRDYFISPESGQENKRRFLSQEAVTILNSWYVDNRHHPYPEEETVRSLASQANINTMQVKKWMANKRVRSSNTLSTNGSIHPKKLQKLIQLQEPGNDQSKSLKTPSPVRKPTKVKDSSNKRAKRQLNPQAVEIMNKWYYEHLHYPYPNDSEKVSLSEEGGIQISQVTCWFANKRNRSNNNKRLSNGNTAPTQAMGDGVNAPKIFLHHPTSVPSQSSHLVSTSVSSSPHAHDIPAHPTDVLHPLGFKFSSETSPTASNISSSPCPSHTSTGEI